MPKQKKEEKKIKYTHRKDAEWLSIEICSEYHRRAKKLNEQNGNNVGERRQLQIELQNRCDILEIEAINITNGYQHNFYVDKYKRIKGILEGSIIDSDDKMKAINKEFLEFLHDKEKKEKNDDYAIEESD